MIKFVVPDEDYLAAIIKNPNMRRALDVWSGFYISVCNVPPELENEFVHIGDKFYAFAKLESNMGKEVYVVWTYSSTLAFFSVDIFNKFHNKDLKVFLSSEGLDVDDSEKLT